MSEPITRSPPAPAADKRIGFTVLYQWQVKPGKLRQFGEAWAELTECLRDQRGALGARLHRSDQGTWMAYAQWVDRAAWEKACELPSVNPQAFDRLAEAVDDTWPPILMTVHDDRIV